MYSVSGKVTINGQPIENGSILFKDPNRKVKSYYSQIQEGAYQTDMEAGKWQVEVTAIRTSKDKMAPNAEGTGMELASEQYIPAKYNEQTTLEMEVDPQGTNQFHYELQSP